MAVSTIDPNGLNIGQIGGTRNMIYNGQMAVNQRGTQTGASSNTYFVDRWQLATTGGTAVFDLKQSTDVPAGQGFATSLQVDVTTADVAMGAGDGYYLRQQFEGQDLQRIAKGTSNAQPMTLQFWVKSPKTGTHIVDLYDFDNTRSVGAAYTISAANTWEHKTIVIPADTSGPFDNDNQKSLALQWWLAAGSDFTSGTLETSWAAAVSANRVVGQVNLVDDAANNFYLTGVQLEVGDTATPFEHRSYGQELALCQRYYYQINTGGSLRNLVAMGMMYDGDDGLFPITLPVPLRSAPAAVYNGMCVFYGDAVTQDTSPTFQVYYSQGTQDITVVSMMWDTFAGVFTADKNVAVGFNDNVSGSYLALDSEL